MFPICGLTATPGKAGSAGQEKTLFLADRFEWYLVSPELPHVYKSNPLKYFRVKNYLANPHHILVNSHQEYELTEQEVEQIKSEPDLPTGFLKRLASDNKRNTLIIKRLLQIPKGKPTLFYACTVEHAYFISVILEASGGRSAAAISSDTPMTIRRGLKEGEIKTEANPMRRLPRPKVPKKIVQDIPLELIREALDLWDKDTLVGVRNRAILLMLLDTGMRLSECANLTLPDLNLENGLIKVWGKGQKQRLETRPKSLKSPSY